MLLVVYLYTHVEAYLYPWTSAPTVPIVSLLNMYSLQRLINNQVPFHSIHHAHLIWLYIQIAPPFLMLRKYIYMY